MVDQGIYYLLEDQGKTMRSDSRIRINGTCRMCLSGTHYAVQCVSVEEVFSKRRSWCWCWCWSTQHCCSRSVLPRPRLVNSVGVLVRDKCRIEQMKPPPPAPGKLLELIIRAAGSESIRSLPSCTGISSEATLDGKDSAQGRIFSSSHNCLHLRFGPSSENAPQRTFWSFTCLVDPGHSW